MKVKLKHRHTREKIRKTNLKNRKHNLRYTTKIITNGYHAYHASVAHSRVSIKTMKQVKEKGVC